MSVVSNVIDEGVKTALEDGLEAHNIPFSGPSHFMPLQVTEHDDKGLVGGLAGKTINSWLKISLFWVREDARGSGVGSRIIQAAEAEARKRGCLGMIVDTYSYQAPEFYKSHGFEIFGTVEDHPKGFRCHFMQKTFKSAS